MNQSQAQKPPPAPKRRLMLSPELSEFLHLLKSLESASAGEQTQAG